MTGERKMGILGRARPTPKAAAEKKSDLPEKKLPANRFELFAYIVDLIRELLRDTAMSVRLYGLILVSVLAIGSIDYARIFAAMLMERSQLAVAGIAAIYFIARAAVWSIRKIRRGFRPRRSA